MPVWPLINIGSDNRFMPDGTKLLPEPMLTYHPWGPVTFTWGKIYRKCSRHAVHETIGRPLAQFDLILNWTTVPENCCEPLKFIMKYISIQFCERPGHGRPFHALEMSRKCLKIRDLKIKITVRFYRGQWVKPTIISCSISIYHRSAITLKKMKSKFTSHLRFHLVWVGCKYQHQIINLSCTELFWTPLNIQIHIPSHL